MNKRRVQAKYSIGIREKGFFGKLFCSHELKGKYIKMSPESGLNNWVIICKQCGKEWPTNE